VNLALPFDALAGDYDRSFTMSTIGRHMRAAVWRRLDAVFQPGDRVLELNCGSGEDAVHLARRGVRVVATDCSPCMLDKAREKLARAGLTAMVDFEQLAIEDLSSVRPRGFDGVLSNFGGLNCVEDLAAVGCGAAAVSRPGGRAMLCVMGPAVPWEWAWYLGHGKPGKAVRRLRRGGVNWRGLTIRYPAIGTVRRAFAPGFVQRRVSAVGALVPPPYTQAWAERHPGLLAGLAWLERQTEAIPPLPWLADHYLIELERL
jgi:SAM-dependent methyltransferase